VYKQIEYFHYFGNITMQIAVETLNSFKVRWHFEIFVSKIFFMTDMRTWDHPDAKFMLSAPPPLPCCFLWRFEVFCMWNFTHSHKISCQTQSFQHFVMIPTGFWSQEKPVSCDDFQFCVEHHGTESWLHIYCIKLSIFYLKFLHIFVNATQPTQNKKKSGFIVQEQ